MKKLILLLVMPVFLFSFIEKEQANEVGELTLENFENDKDFLLDYLRETEQNLRKITKGLSEEQLKYKHSEEIWSVGEVMEHILITEEALLGMSRDLLAQPASPERRSEVQKSDEEVIGGIEDRSMKVKASENLMPTGMYSDPKIALKKLKEQRKELRTLVKKTSIEDLRNHIWDSPFGAIDGYQSLLFLSAHTARHTKQIEEILADPGFPED